MPRRRVVAKRKTLPDPVYRSELVAKFINHLMQDGKKSIAERSLYDAFDIIRKRITSKDPIEVFKRAIENVRPAVEVKSRRVGGATYQIPVEVRPARSLALAMRWIVDFARKRSEKGIIERLAAELMDAGDEESSGGRGKGGAVKKREDTHRMAEANKAFSHFRW
jgi:small subunit ribosomal protein S7